MLAWLPDNTELMGQYQDSGLGDDRFLVRRQDGQIILLTALLYYVLSAIHNGKGDLEQIAADVRHMTGKPVTPENIDYLLGKLQPLGVIETPSHPVETVARADPLLGLALRATVSPPRSTNFLAAIFRPLFLPLVWQVMVGLLVVADWWLLTRGQVTSRFYTTLLHPGFLLATVGLIIGGALFHEVGHASGCRYGGARPGRIGFGMYLMLPAFYTNVNDAYRLKRTGRLRTDLGGIYFNAVFIIVCTIVFYFTHSAFLIAAILLTHLGILEQLLPIVRFDGYYILSDLAGIPDLFGRVMPTLKSWVPWRYRPKHFRRDEQLTRRARVIVTTWVAVTVPALLFALGYTVLHLHGLISHSWQAADHQWRLIDRGLHGSIANLALNALSFMIVVLPVLGLAVFAWRAVKKGLGKLLRNRKEGATL